MEVTVKVQDRHKNVSCDVCGKSMRSNNLRRHRLIHKDLLSLPDDEIKEQLKIRHEIKKEREIKQQRVEEIARENGYEIPDEIEPFHEVRARCLRNYQLYLEKIELGRKVMEIIESGDVVYESLCKTDKEAFDLYRKRKPRFDNTISILRPWQEQALELLETPTDRSIIWICGPNGNEGKSWFQSYIQSHYGFNRVVRLDLRIKHGNLCNVLKKQSLSSLDIFLFNDARSVTGEDYNLYRILENIKDGQATASKYDNDNIHFKTPNTVVIFSNQLPNRKKLSKDRWSIFEIKENDLTTAKREKKEMDWDEKKRSIDSCMEENKRQMDAFIEEKQMRVKRLHDEMLDDNEMTRDSDDSDHAVTMTVTMTVVRIA